MITENIEEYLEALWIFQEEEKKDIVKINEVADGLNISPPSAVEMLKKMEGLGLVDYYPREGVRLTKEGNQRAARVVRNHRIAELLLSDILGMDIDGGAHDHVCGLEHHISEDIAEAVCSKLDHKNTCPHGKPIPPGKCCPP